MTPGYVYILTNPSMPGLVKVGRTSRDVDLRAEELWRHTGVPTPFEVYTREKTCDCIQLEAFIHGDLRNHRLSKSREFFRIDPDEAQDKLRFWVEYQAITAAQEFLGQHFDVGMAVINYREYVPEADIDRLAVEMSADHWSITSAMGHLKAEELSPALSRALDARRLEQMEVFERIGIPQDEWEGMLNG